MPGRFREMITESNANLGGVLSTFLNDSEIGRSEMYVENPSSYRRCWDETHPGPPYASGGGLTLMKADNPDTYVQGRGRYIGLDYRPSINLYVEYNGGFWPNGYGSVTLAQTDMSDIGKAGPYGPGYGSGGSLGPAAYNRFKPKINTADLGQTLAEYAQFVPMLKSSFKEYHNIWKSLGGDQQKKFLSPKAAGDSYLNHAFGWAPVIRDVGAAYDTYNKTGKDFRRLRKQNNRWEHRGGTIETTNERSAAQMFSGWNSLVYPSLPYYFFDQTAVGNGTHIYTECHQENSSRAWFEGRFKYYIPSLGKEESSYDKVMTDVQRYGLRVSPSLVWKVTPWTWLADWFGNAGDIISNAEDNFFGLTSLYAYVMRTTLKRSVNNTTLLLKDGPVNCTWSQEIVTKTRHGSSHFGFGLDQGDFNPGQLAILAALGLSRM